VFCCLLLYVCALGILLLCVLPHPSFLDYAVEFGGLLCE
jgi:hypothetical protein